MPRKVPLDGPVFEAGLSVAWDPGLARTPRVLVPIAVDALVVTGAAASWAACAMTRPPVASDGTLTDALSLMPKPFTDLSGERPPGVYLHWALPDGLTKGSVSTDARGVADVVLPTAPDRWLILRLSEGASPTRRAVTGWVLESGGPDPVVHALDAWVGPGPIGGTEKPMTAMGHGDPAWAAYYDNVVNRLGFHDPAGDVTGRVAYLVCGWYADPALDPLGSSIRSLTEFEQTLERLGWSVHGELKVSQQHQRAFIKEAGAAGLFAKDAAWAEHGPTRDASGNYLSSGGWWPTGMLLHGAAVDVDLAGATTGGPPLAGDMRVALGATASEALAALVAQANQDPDQERTVEALQLGVLHELDQPDGRARLDVVLHASAFGSLPGGPDDIEQIWEPPVPAQPDPPSTPGKPGAGVFANRRAAGTDFGLVPIDSALRTDTALYTATGDASNKPGWGASKVVGSEVVKGQLNDLLDRIDVGRPRPSRPTPRPGRWVQVKRPQPRFFHPVDPFVLVQGGKRSFKHGADDGLADDDRLPCRLSGFTVRSITADLGRTNPDGTTVTGDQLLERPVRNGSVPSECDELLRETVLLDPASSSAAVARMRGDGDTDRTRMLWMTNNWGVEQTAWWVMNDPRIDPGPLLTQSGITGTLPAPIAITPRQHPWNPLHIDWRVEFAPSPGGMADWELGELDFDHESTGVANFPAAAPAPLVVDGRALVTPGAARTLAQAARAAIEAGAKTAGAEVLRGKVRVRHQSKSAKTIYDHIHHATLVATKFATARGDDRADLSTIVDLLDRMDILGGSLDGFNIGLRKGAPAVCPLLADGTPDPAPIVAQTGFQAVRAGTARITALRLVDGFGQYVDLMAPVGATPGPADERNLVLGATVRRTQTSGRTVLTPRFTAPARLLMRWADATLDTSTTAANPVCGYVLPDHLDGGLEFFAADGTNLGNLRADEHPERLGALLWEDAPGSPTTVGRSPGLEVANTLLRGVAQGLLDWGVTDQGTRHGGSATEEGALAALLRIVDSTMWTVDPYGHAGDEHLSLLVGHPVVVLRAILRLEVVDPAMPPELAWTPVPVRLGALTQWQDGLLGFFVGDDYSTVHCAPAAAAMAREIGAGRGFLQQAQAVRDFYDNFTADLAAGASGGNTPVSHPYVAATDEFLVRPNQDVRLTLLVEPHTVVHATCGLLPRKEIGMRREWMAAALASLAPTFRFGPVLRDPDTLRMPIATDIAGTWTWNHKTDVARWVEEEILNAGQDAVLDDTPTVGTEGWLRLRPTPPPPDTNPAPPPPTPPTGARP
jgi:hypothetical protein